MSQLNIKFEMDIEITYTLIVLRRGWTEDEEGKSYTFVFDTSIGKV